MLLSFYGFTNDDVEFQGKNLAFGKLGLGFVDI